MTADSGWRRAARRARGCGAAVLAFAPAGCFWDYSFDGGYRKAATIAIPVFENTTLRRGNEFDLTNAVAREVLTRTPYRVVASPADADLVLRGTIFLFSQPTVVQGFENVVRQSAVVISVKVTVVDGRTGKVVLDPPPHAEQGYVVPARGGTIDTARAEVFDKLAQWVVTQLEQPW